MSMTGFICHDDYLSKTAKLTDEEVGRLFRALMEYHMTGEEKTLEGRESIAFDFIREDIDRTEESYKAKCEKNRNNRLSAIDNERQRSSTVDNVPCQKEKEILNNNTKEKVKEKENRRFTPPTVDDVAEYCKERGNKINPQRFVDFYTTKGWKVGNQTMKDWKACVRTWEQRDTGQGNVKPILQAQSYTQRDYSEPSTSLESLMRSMGEIV